MLGPLTVGSSLKLTVIRQDKTQIVELALRERPVMPWDLPGGRADPSARPLPGAAARPTGAARRTILF